jgi:hypothetical protein
MAARSSQGDLQFACAPDVARHHAHVVASLQISRSGGSGATSGTFPRPHSSRHAPRFVLNTTESEYGPAPRSASTESCTYAAGAYRLDRSFHISLGSRASAPQSPHSALYRATKSLTMFCRLYVSALRRVECALRSEHDRDDRVAAFHGNRQQHRPALTNGKECPGADARHHYGSSCESGDWSEPPHKIAALLAIAARPSVYPRLRNDSAAAQPDNRDHYLLCTRIPSGAVGRGALVDCNRTTATGRARRLRPSTFAYCRDDHDPLT